MLKTIAETLTDEYKGLPVDLQTWRHFSPKVFEWIADINPKIVVEVGAWKGYSTYQLAQRADIVYTIDTWLGALEFYTESDESRNLLFRAGYPSVYYQFAANMHNLGVAHKVIPVPLPSSLGFKVLAHKNIYPDLTYLDGSHEFEDVLDDLNAARELRTKYILGDDYGIHYPGVKKAVDIFTKIYEYQLLEDNEYYFITVN